MSIGIDLGTTFSCVGHYDRGVVRILENENGARTTPSVIAVDGDGEWLVGQHAKDLLFAPNNCIFDVKRIIGRRFNDALLQADMSLWPFQIEDDESEPSLVLQCGSRRRTFSAVHISSQILRRLKAGAEAKLGIPVNRALITVPAYFNAAQRRATQEAGELAGFQVLRILNEPTAAAIAYSLHGERLSKRNVLIYDLGGGTFDVAVVHIDGPRITVKAKGGDTHLGGQDFDNLLMRHVIEQFKKKHDVDLTTNLKATRRLRKAAEAAKVTLSSAQHARIEIECIYESLDLSVKVSRGEFEQMCECLLYSTMVHVERAIREARMQKKDVNEIVLVGGSTRIPRLKQILRSAFPTTRICESIHPDEAVAYGAAVMAAVLSGAEEVQDMRINDMIPLSIGVQCNRDFLSVMIKRGTYFPCRVKRSFQNSEDGQTNIDISIYEGERALCARNQHLGDLSLPITPKRRGENIIEVTLAVDHNGILQATAVDTATNSAISAPIVYDHSSLTRDEVMEMISGPDEVLKADDTFRKRYRQLQKSEDCAYDFKQRLERIQSSVDPAKYKVLSIAIDDEIRWLANFPNVVCEEYERRRRRLRKRCLPTLLLNFSF